MAHSAPFPATFEPAVFNETAKPLGQDFFENISILALFCFTSNFSTKEVPKDFGISLAIKSWDTFDLLLAKASRCPRRLK